MAGNFENNDRDRVLAATDLVSVVGEVVALRPKGREHVGLCPFHEDRTPSMAVVTHKGGFGADAFYKCFACGAGGNAIDFVMNYHKLGFREALKYLADRAGVELTPWEPDRAQRRDGEPTRDDVLRANEIAQRFFRRNFTDPARGERARSEVARRGIDAATVDGFGIGAAPAAMDALVHGVRANIAAAGSAYPPFEAFVLAGVIRPGRNGHIDLLRDRLVFPIRDEMGREIAFGGRRLDPDQDPKYLNSPESPVFHKSKALYGIDRAKRSIIESKTAIITEGYTDVIACHRAGFTNAVATLGTALTREHARVLRRMAQNVVLLFDGDEAGLKAADRALEVFFAETVDIRVCVLPDELDPDDLLRLPGGDDRFRQALEASSDLLGFMCGRLRRKFVGQGLSARQQVIEATVTKFVGLGLNAMNGLRRHLVLQALSDLFDMPVRELDQLCQAIRPRAAAAEEAPQSGPVVEVPPALGSAARVRARIAAERRLLALLCLDPALASVQVVVEGCGALPLSEAIAPSEFADPRHSAIFAVIRDAAEDGKSLRFASLLGELADSSLKSLASDLYAFGDQVLQAAQSQGALAGQRRTATEEVVVSWHDLENLERRVRFRDLGLKDPVSQDIGEPAAAEGSAPSSDGSGRLDANGALERLARARERGHDATAVSALFGRRSSPASEAGRSSNQ